jgi:hypothetical protein
MADSQQNKNVSKPDFTVTLESIGVQPSRGSDIFTINTVRKMKVFPIGEPELDSLSMLNAITTLFSALGTGLIGFAIEQIVDLIKNPNMNIGSKDIISIVCYICFAFTVVCYVIAGWSFFKGKSQLKK